MTTTTKTTENKTESKLGITIKKLQNADGYVWTGIGHRHGHSSAIYGAYLNDGRMVAKMFRRDDGGYMTPALWVTVRPDYEGDVTSVLPMHSLKGTSTFGRQTMKRAKADLSKLSGLIVSHDGEFSLDVRRPF